MFYAVALVLALMDVEDGFSMGLAWGYVVLRVVHSLVQARTNVIMLRFGVFLLSSVVLMVLTMRAVVMCL